VAVIAATGMTRFGPDLIRQTAPPELRSSDPAEADASPTNATLMWDCKSCDSELWAKALKNHILRNPNSNGLIPSCKEFDSGFANVTQSYV
jgi:hypothetical protein